MDENEFCKEVTEVLSDTWYDGFLNGQFAIINMVRNMPEDALDAFLHAPMEEVKSLIKDLSDDSRMKYDTEYAVRQAVGVEAVTKGE